MAYVLLVVVWLNSGDTRAAAQAFATEQSCEQAAASMRAALQHEPTVVAGQIGCVPASNPTTEHEATK